MFESDFAKTTPQEWNLSVWMRPKRDAASGCGDARIDRYFALRAFVFAGDPDCGNQSLETTHHTRILGSMSTSQIFTQQGF
jgi:hypothetical protein